MRNQSRRFKNWLLLQEHLKTKQFSQIKSIIADTNSYMPICLNERKNLLAEPVDEQTAKAVAYQHGLDKMHAIDWVPA